jgi:hypothetical protein
MDRTNDVIVGTLSGRNMGELNCGYGWHDFENYAVSLLRSGFQGRKILFVCNITSDARARLQACGIYPIDFSIEDYSFGGQTHGVCTARWKILHDWLATQTDVRYVIQNDVRDVIIQTDPSTWLEKQSGAKIFVASECILYKDELPNRVWFERLYGSQVLETFANEEIASAGIVSGEAEAIRRLALRVYQNCTERFGDDQSAYNYVLRTEFAKEMRVTSPVEGYALTVGWYHIGEGAVHQPGPNTAPGTRPSPEEQAVGKKSMLVARPPSFREGVVYPYGSDTPFCMIHQYDHSTEWADVIDARYRTRT